jgi:hypothetical protein
MSVFECNAGHYSIKLIAEPAYNKETSDNLNYYDAVYGEASRYRSDSIHGITVVSNGDILKKILIQASGGSTTIHKTSFVIDPDRIAICCADKIFCLSIPDLLLLWETKADTATCFEVFKYKSDYIIHGELEITRLNKYGDIVWQQSGAEIFTTISGGEDDFIITDNYILATDWENRKYKFDFDGNIID